MPRKPFRNNNYDRVLNRRKQNKSFAANKRTKSKWRQCNKNEKPVDLELVKWLCQHCTTLDQQISVILNSISASTKYYNDVQTIVRNLTDVFKGVWYESPIRVLPFGSSVTQLALQESDVDLFIDFQGKIPDNALTLLFNIIKSSKLFKRVIEIKAKVPILQCTHVKNGSVMSCDISFTDIIGVQVSSLMQTILELDSRLKPLLMILKYLIKRSPLIHNKQISSYKVIILCIYYCQQLKEPILPPICVLEKLATNLETINGWKVPLSWTDLRSSLPPVTNQMTVPELLIGFFKFYSEFDFGLRVVSPYMGKSYTKSEFSRIDLLPGEYTCYREKLKENEDFRLKTDCAFCVQDPVAHWNNIMRNASFTTRLKFQRFCRDCYDYLDGRTWDFGTAFASLAGEVSTWKNETFKSVKNVVHVTTFSDLHTLNIFTEEELRSHWYEQVCDKLMSILRRVYRFEVRFGGTLTEEPSYKRIAGKTGHLGLLGSLRNTAQSEFDFPPGMDPITKQELITDYLLDTSLQDIPDSPLSIIIVCSFMRKPTRVQFELIFTDVLLPEGNRFMTVTEAFENILPLLQSVV